MRAEVITAWIGDGATILTAREPRVSVDYTVNWTDSTGQPAENLTPKPNMFIVRIECSPETLLEIEDDPLYQVLWSEE